ncbi:MAG: hypothetical protein KDA45_02895, partial [Planctomycetales bacterium]|nr:hypothetical protein [Planctomycetales bacterium]
PEAIVVWLAQWRARLQAGSRGHAIDLMRKTNPVFIPRNHRVEEAIAAGYAGDFAPFHRLTELLQHPFSEQTELAAYEAAPQPREVVQATFCGT